MSILVLTENGEIVKKNLTLAQAAVAADLAGKTIIVNSPQALAVDWPADRSLEVQLGGIITATSTPQINGSFKAGLYPCFAGAVTFGVGSVPEIYPEWWGAYNDGTHPTETTAALELAIAASIATSITLVGRGTYQLTSTVDFRTSPVDFKNASIDIAHAGLGIYIGGNSANSNNLPQHFGYVGRSVGTDAYATPSIRCVGATCQHIFVEWVGYIQLYADTSYADSYAVQYSTFIIKNCVTLELTNNATTTGNPAAQYINANVFQLDAVQNLYINGTYGHNGNTFNNGNFEVGTIDMQCGQSNYVNNIRAEQAVCDITFGSLVQDCIVTVAWVSSAHRYPNDYLVVVHNSGKMCAVQHLYDLYAPTQPIVGFDYQTLKLVGANYNVLNVSNVAITTTLTVGSYTTFYQSNILPVVGENTIFEIELYKPVNAVVAGGVRTVVTGYDADKVAIAPADNQITFDGSTTTRFGSSSNTSQEVRVDRFFVTDPLCRYISVAVLASNVTTKFDGFYFGARVTDIGLRKKLAAATFMQNNFV